MGGWLWVPVHPNSEHWPSILPHSRWLQSTPLLAILERCHLYRGTSSPRFLCSWPPAHTICLMTSWLVMTWFWDSLTTNPFANGKEKKFFRFLCFLLKWESSPCCDPLQHTDRNDYWDIKKPPISINKNYFLWSTAHWHLKYNAVTFFSVIDVFTRCWCHR